MLERAFDNFIVPLEIFRKDQVPEVWEFRLTRNQLSCFVFSQIGAVKERKKKFDKQTAKFCASQERWELVLVQINQLLINNI